MCILIWCHKMLLLRYFEVDACDRLTQMLTSPSTSLPETTTQMLADLLIYNWIFRCICVICVQHVCKSKSVHLFVGAFVSAGPRKRKTQNAKRATKCLNCFVISICSKATGAYFSRKPRLDLCVGEYKWTPLLLQLSRHGRRNVSISCSGRCKWGCSESFDWWRKIMRCQAPRWPSLPSGNIPHTRIHLRPPSVHVHASATYVWTLTPAAESGGLSLLSFSATPHWNASAPLWALLKQTHKRTHARTRTQIKKLARTRPQSVTLYDLQTEKDR